MALDRQGSICYEAGGRLTWGAEILDSLIELDKGLSEHANPATYVSVVHANAVSYRRLLPYKLKYIRGNFYYLPEWEDEESNLGEDMKDQLF